MKAGCLPPANVNLFGDAAKVAEHLDLNNRELSTIKMSYDLIDIDGSGEIDYDELLEFIESQRSPFSDAVIALVDEQGSGTLDFNSYFRIVCL
jgi:Ca2+-binding EF-hand superfamily protein